jgi:hypothetical protein
MENVMINKILNVNTIWVRCGLVLHKMELVTSSEKRTEWLITITSMQHYTSLS